ncbi:MAG TPA: trigger factor [Candidatus Nanopelagicales bacterium]|nr:trigger factor [Candidatus Nanopelagicales bacterium]
MHVTTTPSEKSTLVVEVELPVDRVARAVADATRRLSQRTRVAGFRPGKAPRGMLDRVLGEGAVWDEAVETLVETSYREWAKATADDPAIFIIGRPEVEVVEAEEGKPLRFKATVPLRPEVKLGDYAGFPFKPEIEAVDDVKVGRVVDEMRDQQATLGPVEERAAAKGDWAVIGFTGTRDGVPFDGGTSERMPLVIGEERLVPGFEEHLVGLQPGGTAEFDITFPDDYQDETLRGAQAHFGVELKELREKILPAADDDFAQSMGDFADMATLRAEIRTRLERNALDRARHGFADRIIDYAVKNATIEIPDILVDEEVEVMHDEMKSALARQGITEEVYLAATGKTAEELHVEFRPGAEERAKTLLVLGEIASREGIDVPDRDIIDEIIRAKARYASEPKLAAYFDTPRAQAAIRSSLRRSRVVETIIDRWLAAHPEHPAIPHAEDDGPAPVPAAPHDHDHDHNEVDDGVSPA